MKREAYEGGQDGPGAAAAAGGKRPRRGEDEITLLIPSKVAGSIIGKGGSNISKLRNQYKAHITVPDCPGPERILTISSDLETILSVVSDIVPNLEENGARVNSDELDLRMLIHQSQAGCVIGKQGAKIKELRDKTGARIKIFSSTAPQSSERIVQMVGRSNSCVDSIREIVTLMKSSDSSRKAPKPEEERHIRLSPTQRASTPIKGPVMSYDPHNYDDYYSEEYGGYGGQNGGTGGGQGGRNGGGGRGGGGGRQGGGGGQRGGPMSRGLQDSGDGQRKFGGAPQRSFDSFGGGGSRNDSFGGGRGNGYGGGNSLGVGGGGGGGFGGGRNDFSSGSRGGNRSSFGGGAKLNNGPPNSQIPAGSDSTQVTIPKDLAGAIIGKGGGRIRKIRNDSGAVITIDEPLPGASDRIITIAGNAQQIQMAQYLLQQSVHESNSGGRGGDY